MTMLNDLEKSILRIIKEQKEISRIDISRLLGVNKPVVSLVVSKLISLGYVREIGKKEFSPKSGRKPILLTFVPDSKFVIGVDIGGTKIEVILTDLAGNILKRKCSPLQGTERKEELLTSLVSLVQSFFTEVKREKVLGVGIGIPGTVDENFVIKRLPAFGIVDWEAKTELEEILELPVFLENNANLDALAESKIGAGRGYKCVLLISIGWGIGAGIVYDGKIFRGSRGKAGEFGHIVTDWEREKTSTPKIGFGRLERWFSGLTLAEEYKKPTQQVFEEDFESLMERIEHLSIAIANAVVLLNPDVIIIKGGIGLNQYEKIAPMIISILQDVVPRDLLEDVNLKKGEIIESGVSIGGVLLTVEKILGL